MLAEKRILHHNFQMPCTMTLPLATIFSFMMSRSLFTPRSLRASNLTMSIQGNHVDSDEPKEEEEEDVVNSRWKSTENFCQRKDLAFELFTNGRVQIGCLNVVFCARPAVLLTVAGAWK